MRRIGLIGAAMLLLAACGDDTVDSPGAPPGDGPVHYTATATVLESPDHGPQLCLGGVATSLPPQCGGPDIVGWDWEEVDGWESAAGTTWGEYQVVGTFDDGVFTLTEPAQAAGYLDEPFPMPDFSSPCPEPDGGWQVTDPDRADVDAIDAPRTYAEAQPEYAGLWVDDPRQHLTDEGPDHLDDSGDGRPMILNVAFTGDLDRHEAELRERWGGALCVTEMERPYEDLLGVQEEVMRIDGVLSSGISTLDNRVELQVVLDDGDLQRELDEQYGPGFVAVESALTPVDR
jgi:hypothetical protein